MWADVNVEKASVALVISLPITRRKNLRKKRGKTSPPLITLEQEISNHVPSLIPPTHTFLAHPHTDCYKINPRAGRETVKPRCSS